MSKRVRPDVHQTYVVLSTRVKEPNDTDWKKSVRRIKCLNGEKKNCLNLSAVDLKVVKCCVDARFVVHPGFNSHTGAIVTIGQGAM